MFRKFFIWVVKSLITLALITLIFSTVALELPNLIKGVFTDIFQYASPETQKATVSKLTAECSIFDDKSYGALRQMANMPISLNFEKIGSLCKDYNSGKVDDQKFFFGVIGSTIPEKLELQKSGALEKYNAILGVLNKNRMAYFALLAVLFIFLYLLLRDIKLFITTLTSISFSIGILILAPYIAIIAYDKFVGIDTTPLLSSIINGSISLDAKAIISVGLLMILRTYSGFIIALGALFFSVGVAGKVYGFMLKRKGKSKETKTKSYAKEKSKAKASSDEQDTEDGKIAKETLDELEEMQKKKSG